MNRIYTGRRDFLKQAGVDGIDGHDGWHAGRCDGAWRRDMARIVEDAVLPAQAEEAPKNHIKFAVCGMSHDHIYGMIGAVQRGGGETGSGLGRRARQDRRLQEALSEREDGRRRRTRS